MNFLNDLLDFISESREEMRDYAKGTLIALLFFSLLVLLFNAAS